METGFRAHFDDEMLNKSKKVYYTFECPQQRYVYRNRYFAKRHMLLFVC
jgi:hypothetical protein